MMRWGWILAWCALMLGAACSDTESRSREVVVSAAASLTDAFAEIAEAFEVAHPRTEVVLNVGGSSALREQILQGADVDVFAAADDVVMSQLAAAGAVAGEAEPFAANAMQIAVPSGNPAGIVGLEDFADPARFIGVCAVGVPCGDLARQVFERAGVDPALDTEEADVRALLTKIETGELDAGLVYVTDVLAGSAVDGIVIPDAVNVTNVYPIAVLADAPNRSGADAFVAFVLSASGQAVLRAHGFAAP